MIDYRSYSIRNMSEIFVVLLLFLTCISARRFLEEPQVNYYDSQQYIQINAALQQLEHAPQWVPDWPNPSIKMGQVSGVAIDNSGHVLVFHRASNTWDATTFTETNVYTQLGDNPIAQPTILVFNDTGELVDSWGQNMFYIPHGITVDSKNNVWVTDVALHQVFKFTPDSRTKPALMLGEKFVPRDDETHFCKPSAVAVMSTGDFFVADGYCNSRIIKFAPDGSRILQWGKSYGNNEYVFRVPHALALAEERGEVCAADREHGRVLCFRADSGLFRHAFRHWLVGARLFSVAYSPAHGGRLYVVNGPTNAGVPVRGYVIDYTSGKLIKTFAPTNGFSNPHDVAVSADGSRVFVAELDPHRALAFRDATRPKPTATTDTRAAVVERRVEEAEDAWSRWGAWGGAAGALTASAALLLALCRARSRGRKSVGLRRWEYGHGEFKLRRLLARRGFTRVHSDDSEDEPAPMLPPAPPTPAQA